MRSTSAASFDRHACWLLLALCVGCGRAAGGASPKASEAPASPASTDAMAAEPQAEPATLAEAEAQLEQARAELDRLALNAPGASATAGAPAPAAQPAPERERAEGAATADEAQAPAPAPPAKAASTCETACKAFASLERAGDAVCRLDIDGGERCQRARRIQRDAAQRVAACGCGN
jgi:hypothetical protein